MKNTTIVPAPAVHPPDPTPLVTSHCSPHYLLIEDDMEKGDIEEEIASTI